MINILEGRNNRWTHDGWALRVKGSRLALNHTACTTRAEARELRQAMGQLAGGVEIIRIKFQIVEVDANGKEIPPRQESRTP